MKAAHAKLRILTAIRWKPEVRERFFAAGGRELPVVRYRGFDPGPALAALAPCPRRATSDPVQQWLSRTEATLRRTASMLAATGTRRFSKHSQAIYGRPTDPLPGTDRCVLDMARRIIGTAERISTRLPPPPAPTLRAGEVAREIRAAVRTHFGEDAPRVVVVRGLTARASAGPTRIRLRRDARFTDLDIRQLIQHEALVHVATALNGRRQRKLPVLAASHAGATRTQEGLAVFAEMMSSSLDLRRLLRLAHRVVAVQMALDGASFLEVYSYFCEHAQSEVEAFESTARIFRGCPLDGGAAFTKDQVYLDGLCRVHVFARAAVQTARIDCLRLLFAGKMDLGDVPAIAGASREGLCRAPRFVPPWVSDPHRVVAYFAVTDVIGRTATAGLRRFYEAKLEEVPETEP